MNETANGVWFDVHETAFILEVSTSALSKWRLKGTGPAYEKPGDHKRAKVWYHEAEITGWLTKKAIRADDRAALLIKEAQE